MDWSMLDTVEKFLVVGGMVSLILAAAAPGKIPYFEVEWSANNRRALAAVGILLLVLSYPPLRNFKWSASEDSNELRQKFMNLIIKDVKGGILSSVSSARRSAWGASTNTHDADGCTRAAITAMNQLDDTTEKLNNLVLEASRL